MSVEELREGDVVRHKTGSALDDSGGDKSRSQWRACPV